MKNADVPRSITRVLDLLETVLNRTSCNLTTAADDAGLSPSTALRHLRALEARGYVSRDDGGDFRTGPTLVRIAASLNDTGPLARLLPLAQPHLDRLARDTGESTYLAVSDRTTATYVATAESDRAIRHVGWVGRNVPIDGTAVGEALASPGRPVLRTGAVEADITALSVALPRLEHLGIAMSVIGPAHRMSPDQLEAMTSALTGAARALADDLGLVPADPAPRAQATRS